MIRALLLTVLLAAASYAQSRPSFAGTWKLNVAKSDFGPLPGADSRTEVIEQSDAGLKEKVDVSGPQGKQNYEVTFKTDGTETANKAGQFDVKIAAAWSGPALVVTTKLNIQDNDIVIKSNWTLSEDGATLMQAVHLTSPMGEADQKLVFEKQ